MISKVFATILLASQASAHFLLNSPATIGFDDDQEGTGPCGSFTPDFSVDNITDFHVGGDSIWLTGTHPTTTFLYRGIVGSSTSGNWSNLAQAILVNGLGDNCKSNVQAPSAFAGQKGLIQVVADSPDGILWQCAAVNFVSGAATAPVHGCKNATGVTMSFVADPTISAALGPEASTSSGSSGSSSTGASPTGASPTGATTSTSKAAAFGLVPPMNYGALGTVAWMVLVTVITGAIRLL